MSTVVLDTTLADLFRRNGIEDDFVITLNCVFMHMDLHPKWPSETTYPEDEEPVTYSACEDERNRLRKIILGLKVVKRAFVVGNMKVLLFQPFVNAENLDRVYTQLPENQRPEPLYINLDVDQDVQKQLLKQTERHKLLFWRPQGWMDQHDCLVSPALAYEINSKKFLVTSGIKTPRTVALNMNDHETKRILSQRKLPFVVKLPWAGCGFGTFIVTTEKRRRTTLQSLKEYVAKGGMEILLSDYVDVLSDLSVHLFIGPPGSRDNKYRPAFFGTSVQRLTEDAHWIGASIDYSMQNEYTSLLDDIVCDTTSRLPDAYIGWCGLDILIDRDGQQWVVDLNARFTGSMPLPLLSTHFSGQRGLDHVEIATFQYEGDIQTAYDMLEPELTSGTIIVIAVATIDSGVTAIDLAWGGSSSVDLQHRAAYIRLQLGST